MPLTNEEFARLEAARVNSMHHRVRHDKRVLQLAFERLEEVQVQLEQALNVADYLVKKRQTSLCHRVPAFFSRLKKRAKSLWT